VDKEIYGLDFRGALKSVMNFRYDDDRGFIAKSFDWKKKLGDNE